jgi:hypothetical protein
VLPLTDTVEPLAFPKNSTEIQPPPLTAFLDALCCKDVMGTVARALLASILQPLTVTFNMSNAATAPPQDEHG